MPTSLYAHNEKLNTLVENDKSLQSLLWDSLSEDNINDNDKQLILDVISIIVKSDYDPTILIQSISTLLNCCDNISLEIQKSLEERLNMVKQEERKKILNLYPTPKQGQGKDRRYRCRPYICGKSDKREICKPTLKEAEDEIIRRHKENEIKSMTLWEALIKYDEDRDDICDSTKVHHEQDIKRFAKDLINKPISEITAMEIQKSYISAIKETDAAKRACNNYKGILRKVFKYAKKHCGCEVIDIDDCIDDLNSDVNRKIIKNTAAPMLLDDHHDHYLKEEVIDFLTEVSRRNTLRAYAAAEPFFTGKRISEVSGMFKSDLDLDTGKINLCHASLVNKRTTDYYLGLPKGGKKRIIVIPTCSVNYYKRILKLSNSDSPYFYPDNDEKRRCDWLATHKIDDEIEDICATIGIIKKSAHDMRRTYDSMLDNASMPIAMRHLLVGHELTGIEASYLRDSHNIEEIRAIIDLAFAKFLGEDFEF